MDGATEAKHVVSKVVIEVVPNRSGNIVRVLEHARKGLRATGVQSCEGAVSTRGCRVLRSCHPDSGTEAAAARRH